MRQETRCGAQVQAYCSNTTLFLTDSFSFVFTLLFLICKLIFLYSIISYSNNIFVLGRLADKYSIVPNFSLVNEPNLTRILQSEIFVHTDEQLRAAHIILSYRPISTNFQAPKYVIKAKDSRLHQINIAVPGFLTSPPPKGTHLIELPSQCSTEEEATSSHLVLKKQPGQWRFRIPRRISKFLTSLNLQSLQVLLSANFLLQKSAASRKLLIYLMQWCYKESPKQVCSSSSSLTLEDRCQRWPSRPNLPPLFPPTLPSLNLRTIRENGTERAKTWLRKERSSLPKSLSPKKGPKQLRT